MSIDTRKDLPPVTSKNFLEKAREALSVYLGNRGDLLDRGITLRDLTDSGIVTLRPGFLNGGRNPIGGPGYGIEPAYDIDLTPPPTPTGFTATAAISNLMVQCDPQLYRAGHGHAKSVLYGASWVSGALPVFTDAVVLEEFSGTVFSHATNPATTWHLWLKWVTVDGVASTNPAGGTNGVVTRTGEDVALLLTALTGQITRSQLYSDIGTPIDRIGDGPVLPYSLVQLAAMQDGLNQQTRIDLNATANSLLESVVTISNTLQTVHDAGININPATGLVEIFGLEVANDHLNTVDVRLNAAEGNINLKASVTYVDGAIAAATLTPTDLLLFDGMSARIGTAEADINALESSVTLKATNTDLSATNVRMTTAEGDINALEGQIVLKVNSVDYAAVTGGLDARLGSAEVSLASIGDVSAITSIVQQGSARYRTDAEDAETLLRSILNNEKTAEIGDQSLAIAREDLRAYTDAGVLAEASQRLLLAAVVASNTAQITEEKTTRAAADSAEASARTTLAARVSDAEGALLTKASITQVASAKAEAISASASVTDTLSARLNTGDFAAVQVQSSASASAITGLNAQYTIKQDVAGLISGYGLASTASNAAPSSAFGVRSNQFFIAPPATVSAAEPTSNLYDGYCWLDTGVTPAVTRYRSGATWSLVSPVLPFVVQATPTTINGVAVPAGVYASDLYVMNGTITNAKIGNLAVDDAKIANLSVAKLVAGSIAVGQYIQSTSYIAGTQGWRINGDGTCEIGSTYIRGQLVANQIDTRGLSIKDGAGNIILAAGTALDSSMITASASWLNSNVSLGTLGFTGATNANYTTNTNQLTDGANLGGTAAWGGVTSRPTDLAGLDVTASSKLGGIAAGADVTGANTAAGIAGQGAFATASQITSGNASTFIAAAAIGSAQIGSISTANLSVSTLSNVINGSSSYGQRVEIASNVVRVYDASNVLRVKIGDLA